MSFQSLGLSESILRAIKTSGYKTPTPIQMKAIPEIINGNDIMAAAQTGTGKTAGFTLPLLEILSKPGKLEAKQTRALIITPTRELAAQVDDSVRKYGKHLSLKTAVVFGGVNMHRQIKALKQGVDILVATPGRLLDLYRQKAIYFSGVEILVLDEADRMLDMGFLPDIKTILSEIPQDHQTLMFSATFSKNIRQLAKNIMQNPVEINTSPRNSTVKTIKQVVHPVDKARKPELLKHLLKENDWYQVLVFSRTKHGADKLVKKLSKDKIASAAIHGNKSQAQRTRALKDFKSQKTRVLVATDIAARGIDINQLSHVINFDLPQVPEDYIHRIGRTGRAGADGKAISLVSADEANNLFAIESLIQQKLSREEIEGFEADHALPEKSKAKSPSRKKRSNAKRANNDQTQSKKNHRNSNKAKPRSEKAKRSKNKNGSPSKRQFSQSQSSRSQESRI